MEAKTVKGKLQHYPKMKKGSENGKRKASALTESEKSKPKG
ncbi:hypothetical protein [Mesobacillus subterraneus]|nr:hypothetical protein [Mesobacillus subterraneus]